MRRLSYLMPLVVVAAVVAVASVAFGACRSTRAEYHRESEHILGDLPVYPGSDLVSVATELNTCETFCWARRSYYTLATYSTTDADVGGATGCAAAGAIALYYARTADDRWHANTETFPTTWPNAREGCAKILTLTRGGAKVYVNVNSTESGGLSQITVSVSH